MVLIASKVFPGMLRCANRDSHCGDCVRNTGLVEVDLWFNDVFQEWQIHVGCQQECVEHKVWQMTNEEVIDEFGHDWGTWHKESWDKVLDWLIASVEEALETK
jgi:hypothetical protein